MKKKQPLSFGFGYFIAPFLLFGIISLFSPSNPSSEETKKYIASSKEIVINNPKAIYDGEGEFVHRKKYYLNFRKNRFKHYAIVFSDSLKKYFVIDAYEKNMPDPYNFEKSEKLVSYVNKDEFHNPKYGSIENPVPILWINQTLEPINSTDKALYEKNVTEYLRFYKNRQKYNEGACAVCPY
jgi:hypothetical protein